MLLQEHGLNSFMNFDKERNRQLLIVVGLIEHNHKLLITRRYHPERSQWHHKWEFPGGKIQPNEIPLEALHREILEETGLTVHSAQLLGVHTHVWQLPEGTQQTFILVYYCHADKAEVQLTPNENDAYLWVDPAQIPLMDHMLDGTVDILNTFVLDPLQV